MKNFFRMQRCSELKSKEPLYNIKEVAIALANRYGRSLRERMVVVYFCQGKPLGAMEYIGTSTGVSVSVGEIAAGAVKLGATAVFGFHTHPSGGASLSKPDKAMIDKLSTALDYIEIELIDVLVRGNGYGVNDMYMRERFYSARLNSNLERQWVKEEPEDSVQMAPQNDSQEVLIPIGHCESENCIESVLPINSLSRKKLIAEYMRNGDLL